jgi:Protein of unknown function (DUF1579)
MITNKIMNSLRYMALIIFLCLFAQAANVSAQNDTQPADGASMDKAHQEMMAKMMEYATPGEGHKALEPLVGNWDYTVTWWETPDAKPQKSTGTSEAKWIMGGRYLEQTAEGMSMGQEFKGMGIMGYDNMEKEYNGVWIDNMGTGMMTSTGSYDPAAKSFTEKGSFTCPQEGGEKSYHGVTTLINPDKYTYEMYVAGKDGKEVRVMEIVYTRKK